MIGENTPRDALYGALIGVARAAESNPAVSGETLRVIIKGLLADESELADALAAAGAEKRRLAPDCSICANPCGRTADYDMRLLANDAPAVQQAKRQLLWALGALAAALRDHLPDGQDAEDCTALFCEALFKVGYEATADALWPVLTKVEQAVAQRPMVDREEEITLLAPADGAEVALVPEDVRLFRRGNMPVMDTADGLDWRAPQLDGTERSHPLAVHFAWEGAAEATLHVSRTADFATEQVYPAVGGTAEVENLRIGTLYYWHVTAGDRASTVATFTTEGLTPRMIHAEGLTNVRDQGGWRTVTGQRIRQGMLFRGSEMDTHHTLTPEARLVLRETLGIRTDMDLRAGAVGVMTESPLGADIRYEQRPVVGYAEYFAEGQQAACRAVFSLLADETAYPIYMHCWGGADRTGTVLLLLGGLLGMDDESLLQDYELTSFAIWGKRSRTSELFRSLLASLEPFGADDAPLREKAVRYLESVGVEAAQMAAIRRILLAAEA